MFTKPLKMAATIVGTSLGLGGFFLLFNQEKFIYYPDMMGRYPRDNEEGFRHPFEGGLDSEDVTIQTPDGLNLRGWFVKTKKPKNSPTIVIFQGNAGNIGYRIPFIKALNKRCNANVLIVGYRGYSYSDGKPTERGLQIDSLAVMDYIFSRKDIDTTKIFILGTSLGGAVGAYAAHNTRHEIAGLILENTFTSIADMVEKIAPKLSAVKYMLTNKWETINIIDKIKCPLLFIIGMKDELVPPTQTLTLFENAKTSILREKVEVPNGTHNDTWGIGSELFFGGISNFIEKVEILRLKGAKL